MAAKIEDANEQKSKDIITWGDLLSVKNKKLDEQHMSIVDAINKLSADQSLANLLMLQKLFAGHLKTEQELFEQCNYTKADRDEHVKAHISMLAVLKEVVDKTTASDKKMCDPEFPNNFAKLFIQHAFEYDSKYIDYFQQHITEL
mmetsp:Transcript_43173/g.71325  ORF Transcript_43173/g.71325 Transcript_43173/m.71325 type:complete len:145 (-) Transcript_43173:133-567(-)|eukprot:CAMPEP_0202685994 /NCGR_PEP_ID=MMETSP1385-20130828/1779_1 /ASSEMBLY_ACC=CAM_ASM_000861 /TAXON_ID=933848 /ORGANISM="Elphidium margaritaceum" /LENGTH=144 /DNA_ID=CAMNT_0049340475 /DNA_START=43 /DNA_END=477 /DNA_ORIENTATION=-